MFICMSSGYRERYRQDVILALAMPKGCHLQFRYDKKWISPKVIEGIKAGKLTNTLSAIVYIAQYDKDNAPQLIPCRFVRIDDAKIHGSTVSLSLSLEGFAYAENTKKFNEQISSLSQDMVVRMLDWACKAKSAEMPRDITMNIPTLNFFQSHPNIFPILQKLLQNLEL